MTRKYPLLFLACVTASVVFACSTGSRSLPNSPLSGVSPDTLRERTIVPGVRQHYLWLAEGPWAVQLIEIDPAACGVVYRTAKARDQLVGREATSVIARRMESELGRPVLVAINGDFFSFEPSGVPEGPQVIAGELVKGPGGHREAVESRRLREQPVFGVTDAGAPFIGDVSLAGSLRVRDGYSAAISGVNVQVAGGALVLLNGFLGDSTPADSTAVELVVHRFNGASTDSTRGVVAYVDTAASGVPLPEGSVVFSGRGRGAVFLRTFSAPGDTLVWTVGFSHVPGPVREMIGGFPLLLQGGEDVLDQVEDLRPAFSAVRHPRTAIGMLSDGRVLLLTVDGRQPGHSEGMTLRELTDLLRALGATDAINLDGGGSTTLVILGEVMNRPSDAAGERPVANMLLVLGPQTGACGQP